MNLGRPWVGLEVGWRPSVGGWGIETVNVREDSDKR